MMENRMETSIQGVYRGYRVYIEVILGQLKRKWKLQCRFLKKHSF